MARKTTRAREARNAARQAENAAHDARRAATAANTAKINAEYRTIREAQEAREATDDLADHLRKINYERRMKALTGHKNGIGEWVCTHGHRHKTTSDCHHGKNKTETVTPDATGSTARNLPLNTVAGQRVDHKEQQEWNRRTA